MGPTLLFDKSFLQSLTLDESVWLDHFFNCNVSPIFFAETLADLSKPAQISETAEREVAIIADKFPEMHGAPNVYHRDIALANLLGQDVPMTGQILLTGGRPVGAAGSKGFVFDSPPEREAFSRWQQERFSEIEQQFARGWRQAVESVDLDAVTTLFRGLGVNSRSCKTLADAKALAAGVVQTADYKPIDRIQLCATFLNLPPRFHKEILQRYKVAGYPPLSQYAPYAAFVFTIDLFFHIAVAAQLIGSQRASNRIDMAYLYYLPFCMIFVSNDRLHGRCAPLLLPSNQEFVSGIELKKDLRLLNAHFLRLPPDIRERGVLSFASRPPQDVDSLVARLWDRHLGDWRSLGGGQPSLTDEQRRKLVAQVRQFQDAPTLDAADVDFDSESAPMMSVSRQVRRRKGSWYQMPRDFKN